MLPFENSEAYGLARMRKLFYVFQRTFSIYKPLQNANIENFKLLPKLNLGRKVPSQVQLGKKMETY